MSETKRRAKILPSSRSRQDGKGTKFLGFKRGDAGRCRKFVTKMGMDGVGPEHRRACPFKNNKVVGAMRRGR